MNDFRKKVYEIASRIPKGKVATYGQIARLAGHPHSARAVGRYMSENTDMQRVPCHRVVGSDGALVGYAFHGTPMKRKKLLDEGVAFNGARVNLSRSLWNGA